VVRLWMSAYESNFNEAKRTPLISAGALMLFLVLTFLAPAAGVWGMPGEWYAGLNKPSWNPPSWVFGPVWTTLYTCMAVAAWLVWRQGGWKKQRLALTAYVIQLVLNAAWTPIFFGLQQPGWALVEILFLLAAILITVRFFAQATRCAAGLLLPYAAWVAFASFLNFTLWRMNT
jgi:translocator protein